MKSIYVSFDGVSAKGNDYIPPIGSNSVWEKSVLERHYDNSKLFDDLDEVFLLETTQTPGKAPLVYYQYLRYKGVKDRAGRTPSVFGVTIATDTFCPDSEMMLSLCRDIFHKCVVAGKLLAMSTDGSITWLCNTLSDPQAMAVHKDAEDKLVKILTAYKNSGMLTDMPVAGWTVSPPLSLNNEAQLLVKMNPSDVNGHELASLLKSGKKVAIASDFPPKSAQRAIDQANSAKLAAEKNAASLSASLDASRNEVARLSSEKAALSKDLTDSRKQSAGLTRELETLKAQQKTMLSRYEAKGNYSCQQQLNDLKARLDALAPGRNPMPDGGQGPKRPLWQWILVCAASAILLMALAFFLGRCSSSDKKESGQEGENKEQAEGNKDQTIEKKIDGNKSASDDQGPEKEGFGRKAGNITSPTDEHEDETLIEQGLNVGGHDFHPGEAGSGSEGALSGSEGQHDQTYDFDPYYDLDDESWQTGYYYAYSRR